MTLIKFPERLRAALAEDATGMPPEIHRPDRADVIRRRDAASRTHAVRPPPGMRPMDKTGRALCDAIRIEAAGDDRDALDAILAEDEAALLQAGDEAGLRREVIGDLWQGRAVTAALWIATLAAIGVFVWAGFAGVAALMAEALG